MASLHPDSRINGQTEGILSVLTAPQREAVQHIDGPLLILAGPGSGKTRVVTHRIAYLLLEGIPDDQITALTFTNKAADEMRSRLDILAPGHRVWLGTFHRFCSRLLRQYGSMIGLRENFSIFDTDDSKKLLNKAIEDLDIDLEMITPRQVAQAISSAKNELMTANDYMADYSNPAGVIAEDVYPQYQKRLLAANAVDFDDLLMHAAMLLRENPELRTTLDERFRYIMVDEYQDTNLAQYVLVRAMSIDHPNLAVTGDPDQSIYGWRGASIRNILSFEKDYQDVHVVRLEQNYRSTKNILLVADQLIAHNTKRKEKKLFTENPDGPPVRLVVYQTSHDEAQAIAARIVNEVESGRRRPRDFAIFYRANALSRTLERGLKAVALPYQIVRGLEFYQRKEIKDVVAYMQLMNNPENDVAFLRIINTPPRRIGKKTIQHITVHARRHDLTLLNAARESGLIESLTKRAAVQVARFVAVHDQLCSHVHEPVTDIVEAILDETGFRKWLEQSESEEDQRRLENVEELVTDAREFDITHPEDGGLQAFLEDAALVADTDDWESDNDRVTLMTLHAAKGLEFPVVFIVAVEEKLLPHERSSDNDQSLEEERRLLFVGITRAEQELHLSAAQRRSYRGRERPEATSRFLMELPHEAMQIVGRLGFGSDIDPADEELNWYDQEPADKSADGEFDEGQFDDESLNDNSDGPSPSGLHPGSNPSNPGWKIHTASELAGEGRETSLTFSPEQFAPGMVVIHPEYGVGKILATSGSGEKRKARVRFAGPPGEATFQLAFSPLRPVTT